MKLKNTFKKIEAVVLAIAMVATSVVVYDTTAKAATVDELTALASDAAYNLALNKITEAYPAAAEGNITNLNNGKFTTGGSHCALSKVGWNYSGEVYAVIDLGDYYDASSIDEIVIQYKSNANNVSVSGESYSIQYSVDGLTYYDAVADTYVYPADDTTEGVLKLDENNCTTDDVSGVEGTVRYVKIYYPATANYGIHLTEVAVFASEPVIVEPEKCDDAAGVTLTSNDYNSITYNITAGEGQEDYVYMVYLDDVTSIGKAVVAGQDYTLTGITGGAHTVKVVAIYDGKVSAGITSEEVVVEDLTAVFGKATNVASVVNNEDAKILSVSSFYTVENPESAENATLERAQTAIDGTYETGENKAIRTAKDVDSDVIIDLGSPYKSHQFESIVMAYTNGNTDVPDYNVAFSTDNETYTQVGSVTDFSYSSTNKASICAVDMSLYAEETVRYVKLTLTGGGNGWGYVVNEIGVILNVDADDAEIITDKTPVEAPTVASKEYTGKVLTADVEETGDYTVTTNAGGTDVGTYEVVLTLVDPANYYWSDDNKAKDKTKTLTFEITKATNEWTTELAMESWTYGEEAKAPVAASKIGEIVYTYSTAVDGEYTDVVPETVGTYFVKAEVVGTDNYDGLVATAEFAIAKAANEWTTELAMESWTYGEEAKAPVAEAKFGEIVYTYSTAVDGEYTDVVPENAGTYYVKAEVAGTDNYDGLVATAEFTIAKAAQAAPEGITVLDSTLEENADGKISGLTTDMEFRAEGEEEYKEVTSEEITDILAGTYYVRYKETDNYSASEDTEVVVGTGRKFTVTLTEGTGYVLAPVAEDNQVTYGTNFEFKVELSAGYQKGANFVVKVDDVAVEANAEGIYTIENVTADAVVTVEGVEEVPETTVPPTTVKPGDNTTTVAPGGNNTTTVAPGDVVAPGKVAIKKATKKLAAKKASVTLKAVKGATGYEVAIYKTKKNAKKDKKAIVKVKVAKVKAVLKNKKLKKAKKLFVRARAYVEVNGAYTYGTWSKVKKVKIK